eukprot:1059099-Pelagomonas_calceolata.AAC.4
MALDAQEEAPPTSNNHVMARPMPNRGAARGPERSADSDSSLAKGRSGCSGRALLVWYALLLPWLTRQKP